MSELLVPTRADALYVDKPQVVTGPMADHEILPWFDGHRDHYSNVPFLSGAINAAPFADHSYWLEPGVHLHWTLPDGLTRGSTHRSAERPVAVDNLWFAPAPNRWLIWRRADQTTKTPSRVWLVESDYVHTDIDPDTGKPRPMVDRPNQRAIAYPYALGKHGQAPYLYLGRQIELNPKTLLPEDSDTPIGTAANALSHYTAPLTALGHGDPSFAAHYPTCRSVFGLYDDQPAMNEDGSVQSCFYDVFGWYSDLELDPLAAMVAAVEADPEEARALILRSDDAWAQDFLREQPDTLRAIDWLAAKDRALKRRFGWETFLTEDPVFPDSILCHARTNLISWDNEEEEDDSPGHVAIGASPAEACAAYLMRGKKDHAVSADFQDQLVQSLAATDLSSHALDLSAKLAEARHNEQFHAMPGHAVWVLRPREGGAETAAGVTLPDDIAHELNLLNTMQQRYDKAVDQIDGLRQELYSDWVHYMRAAYPEGDTDPFRVDLDQLRYTIERTRLEPLEQHQRRTGHLYFGEDDHGNQVVVDRHALPGPILGQDDGSPFAMRLPPREFATGLNIRADMVLHGLQLVSDSGAYGPMGDVGKLTRIKLRHGERIVAIQGLTGRAQGQHVFAQVMVETSHARRLGPFGQAETGLEPFRFEMPPDMRIVGLRGHSTGQIAQLGLLYANPHAREHEPEFGRITLARQVVGQHVTVLQTLAKHGSVDLVLGRTPGQRYFRPNDPIIALGGKSARATKRHGHDGLTEEDGLSSKDRKSSRPFLQTATLDLRGGWTNNSAKFARNYRVPKGVGTMQFFSFGTMPWLTLSRPADWHPLLLEWQAELQPLQGDQNRTANKAGNQIASDFLESRHRLSDTRPEIVRRKRELAPTYEYLSGRSILNPSVTRLMAERIKALPASVKSGVAQHSDQDMPMILPLGGFHDQLLMRDSDLQLPIADPVGLPVQRELAERVSAAVGGLHPLTPKPQSPFHPVRAGDILVQRLRVIDSFGRTREWRPETLFKTKRMRTEGNIADRAVMPARFSQASRLEFRWISAVDNALEANDHPASTPVCGWVLANELDREIVVYANDGQLLGSVDTDAVWHGAEGDPSAPRTPREIKDKHLGRFVRWLTEADKAEDLVDAFLDTIEVALDQIDPVKAATQQARAMLISRPLALVRAQIDLNARHHVAQDQSWRALRKRMNDGTEDTHSVERLQVGVRLGESNQLNDGLCGYWLDGHDGLAEQPLFTPMAFSKIEHPSIKNLNGKELGAFPVKVSFGGAPVQVTMLMDPLSVVHATTGILPTKSIGLPADQFKDQMDALRVTFSTAPILTPTERIEVPLPAEAGYAWSWLEKQGADWRETPHHPTLRYDEFVEGFGQEGPALWHRLIMLGRIAVSDHGQSAELRSVDPEADPTRFDDLGLTPEGVERGLHQLAHGIGEAHHEARLNKRVEARDGWLQLRPVPQPTTDEISES